MDNKFFFLKISLIISCVATAQQKPFTIKGNIKGKTDGYMYLSYQNEGSKSYILDSALVENGKFLFKGKLNGPTEAAIMLVPNPISAGQYAQLYLVPGNMQLSLDAKNFSESVALKGSSVQVEADRLKKTQAPIMAQIKPFSEAYDKASEIYRSAIKAKKDETTLDSLKQVAENVKDAMEPYQKKLKDVIVQFMDNYPRSYVTASMLRFYITGMPLAEGEERYDKLPQSIRSSNLGQELKKDLDGLRMGSPGSKAFEFSSKELRGEPLSLADYKGKYVLLDFWASWCVPCRKSNPHLKDLYSKYKGKGFEIIGISDDDNNHDAWRKAVENDQIGIWKHVLRGFDMKKRMAGEKNESDISEYYGIHSLPTKILIDPKGMIIGRYGGGGEDDDAMDKKLSEIFGG